MLDEHCHYGALHEELIRARLVVGLADLSLSEHMQLDKDLTLAKAIEMARQTEVVKQQQSDLHRDTVSKGELLSRQSYEQRQSVSEKEENQAESPHIQCPANDEKKLMRKEGTLQISVCIFKN